MSTVLLLVEGESEFRFVRDRLNDYFAGRYVLQPILTETRRGVRSGGLARDYAVFRRQMSRLMAQHGGREDAWFGCMLDLYGLPAGFPGHGQAPGNGWEMATSIETALATDLAHERFLPYLNVHELEALLLTELRALGCFFTGKQSEVERLAAEVARFSSPEEINLTRETSPSHRIARHLPGYAAAKVQASSVAFSHISISLIRKHCPHFSDWLTRIEQLPAY